MNAKWISAAACVSAVSVLFPLAHAQEEPKENSRSSLERQALERVRSVFESKTQTCGESIFAHMGPYAINEYRNVRYRIIASDGKGSGETAHVQAVATIRQYWANDGKWRSWARHQIVLDLDVTQDSTGELHIRPVAGADTSGEELKPITCDQVPKPDADTSTTPR